VYSQLCYYKESPHDHERRKHWTNLYARHLAKWLVHDDFTTKKTVITYEGMKSDMHGEIENLCRHFVRQFDPVKLDSVLSRVSKDELKRKTKHDRRVVNLSDAYRNQREVFRKQYGRLTLDELCAVEPSLEKLF